MQAMNLKTRSARGLFVPLHKFVIFYGFFAILSGCLRNPDPLTVSEVQEIAWYVEDICHGIERDPYELAQADASHGKQDIMLWAMGTVRENQSIAHPTALTVRQERWPLIRQGLRQGVLQVDEGGLLRLASDADEEQADLYRPGARQENLDRLSLVAILLARGRIPTGSARAEEMTAALREARRGLDLSAGGTPWEQEQTTPNPDDESASSSPSAPTTSRSNPDPFDRRGGF